ncbi:MAG: cytochrome c [Anaerolineales bacterium]|nr:cytochrome c [Anaerolineales bacterium]
MRRYVSIMVLLLGFFLLGTGWVNAANQDEAGEDLVAGAQLYDKWYAATGQLPPQRDHPIWSRQASNTRSGGDTWRCVECHGWDYKGFQGAYGAGSHYTGFPNLISETTTASREELVSHLKGGMDPAHDFSIYLDDISLQQLALFLKTGLIDDSKYIDDVTLEVINGNVSHGKQLFDQSCAACHGGDGQQIIFRSEGVDEYLGSIARRDPWRFLHRTRFGLAGVDMPIGHELGWTATDGRDVLAYVQIFLGGEKSQEDVPASEVSEAAPLLGGPARDLWSGMLTGLGTFAGIFGGSLIFILVLLILVGTVVWVLRSRE